MRREWKEGHIYREILDREQQGRLGVIGEMVKRSRERDEQEKTETHGK